MNTVPDIGEAAVSAATSQANVSQDGAYGFASNPPYEHIGVARSSPVSRCTYRSSATPSSFNSTRSQSATNSCTYHFVVDVPKFPLNVGSRHHLHDGFDLV